MNKEGDDEANGLQKVYKIMKIMLLYFKSV